MVVEHRLVGAAMMLFGLCLAGCAVAPVPVSTPTEPDAASVESNTASVEPVEPVTIPTANPKLTGWVGDYDYEELLGSTEDEQAQSTIDYHITIDANDVATVSMNGFQTMANLLASIKGDATTITLVFTGYTSENLWQPYAPGDELLTLSWQGNNLITTWGAIKPQLDQNQGSGQYFQGDVG